MGKIKSRLIKKIAEDMIKKNIKFSNDFEENKKILKDEIPNKRIRNQLAGIFAKKSHG